MISRRTIVVGVALFLLVFGVSLAEMVSIDLSRTVLVPLVAVLGLGSLTAWAILGPLSTRSPDVTNRDPELPESFPVPGESFDRELGEEARYVEREDTHTRTRIRNRLEDVAIDVLTAHGRQTRAEAIDAIDSGQWTDDTVAAAFLGGTTIESSRIRGLLGSSDAFARGVRRSVEALTRYTGRTPPATPGSGLGARIRSMLTGDRARHTNPQSRNRRPEGDLPDPGAVHDRSLGTWDGMVALSIGSLGVGTLLADPALILVSALGVGYLTYSRVSHPPTVDLTIDRSIDEDAPAPGERIRVTLSIRNVGDRTLADLRVIDGVPPGLAVTEGSPRVATPLGPGEAVTLSYAVTARRGVHEFDPVRVAVRDVAESIERETRSSVATEVVCRPRFDAQTSDLRSEATQYVGQLPTESGGAGIEFHSVREYRHGDAVSRIDWKRLARTKELASINFRQERAATVVCVVDARASAFVSPESADVSACDREIEALSRLFPGFLDTGNRVGLAAFAPEPCWIAPSAAREVRSRAREAVTTHTAFPTSAPDERCYTLDWIEEFRRRHDAVQVVFLSPLVDEGSAILARRLEIYGYPVTVVSVDPTATKSVGTQLAHLERQARIHDLREAGVRVLDWTWNDSLELSLAKAERRWSP